MRFLVLDASNSSILQAIVWLADMADFSEMNAVWDNWIPTGCAPVRACGEAKLANLKLKVEIIIVSTHQ